MNRKKYTFEDYNKKEPFDESCVKFFVIYEGTIKEPNYFEAFNETFIEQKKAYIHHILESESPIKGNMPKNLLDRVVDFIENPPKDLRFTPSKTDRFRFVLDIDKHPKEQIESLKNYSDSLVDSNLYISNFCFEVWLWFHFEEQEKITSKKSKEIKTELGIKQNEYGINFPHSYMAFEKIKHAIERAEKADIEKDNYFPVEKSTKVYLLIKELLEYSILNNHVDEEQIL